MAHPLLFRKAGAIRPYRMAGRGYQARQPAACSHPEHKAATQRPNYMKKGGEILLTVKNSIRPEVTTQQNT